MRNGTTVIEILIAVAVIAIIAAIAIPGLIKSQKQHDERLTAESHTSPDPVLGPDSHPVEMIYIVEVETELITRLVRCDEYVPSKGDEVIMAEVYGILHVQSVKKALRGPESKTFGKVSKVYSFTAVRSPQD